MAADLTPDPPEPEDPAASRTAPADEQLAPEDAAPGPLDEPAAQVPASELARVTLAYEVELETVREQLAEWKATAERLNTDYQRLVTRTRQQVTEAELHAIAKPAIPIIESLDNLERAVEHIRDAVTELDELIADESVSMDARVREVVQRDAARWREMHAGFEMVVSQFHKALLDGGISPIDAVGKPFDHDLHQAVLSVASDDVEVDTVVKQEKRGYLLHDRVLRPAVVVVAQPRRAA